MSQYFLNEVGVACALGSGRETVARRLFAGDTSGMRAGSPWLGGHKGCFGAIPERLPELPAHLGHFDCRNNRTAALVADQVAPLVDELRQSLGAHRLGVVMGTSTSGIANGEARLGGEEIEYSYRYQQQMAGLAEFVARYLQIEGPRITVSTACSSSANAFASARRLLAGNICDAVVVGGVDTLCGMTVKGFHSLSALSNGLTKPFSGARDGINLGEAAALFVLSRQIGKIRLCGVAGSSDAYHMSAPEPAGRGAEAAMRGALADANLAATDIDYLNLHGTGTPQNDAMEARAVNTVLGEAVHCSSTKPLSGHTLGAAGALEAAFCWLALAEGRLPPHRFDGDYDAQLQPVKLYTGSGPVQRPRYTMSNSFAFGGSNCSVILGLQGEQ